MNWWQSRFDSDASTVANRHPTPIQGAQFVFKLVVEFTDPNEEILDIPMGDWVSSYETAKHFLALNTKHKLVDTHRITAIEFTDTHIVRSIDLKKDGYPIADPKACETVVELANPAKPRIEAVYENFSDGATEPYFVTGIRAWPNSLIELPGSADRLQSFDRIVIREYNSDGTIIRMQVVKDRHESCVALPGDIPAPATFRIVPKELDNWPTLIFRMVDQDGFHGETEIAAQVFDFADPEACQVLRDNLNKATAIRLVARGQHINIRLPLTD